MLPCDILITVEPKRQSGDFPPSTDLTEQLPRHPNGHRSTRDVTTSTSSPDVLKIPIRSLLDALRRPDRAGGQLLNRRLWTPGPPQPLRGHQGNLVRPSEARGRPAGDPDDAAAPQAAGGSPRRRPGPAADPPPHKRGRGGEPGRRDPHARSGTPAPPPPRRPAEALQGPTRQDPRPHPAASPGRGRSEQAEPGPARSHRELSRDGTGPSRPDPARPGTRSALTHLPSPPGPARPRRAAAAHPARPAAAAYWLPLR